MPTETAEQRHARLVRMACTEAAMMYATAEAIAVPKRRGSFWRDFLGRIAGTSATTAPSQTQLPDRTSADNSFVITAAHEARQLTPRREPMTPALWAFAKLIDEGIREYAANGRTWGVFGLPSNIEREEVQPLRDLLYDFGYATTFCTMADPAQLSVDWSKPAGAYATASRRDPVIVTAK